MSTASEQPAIPWKAVGEPYTAEDVVEVVRFLIQKGDERYDELAAAAERAIRELAAHGRPPAKLTLGERVADLERQVAGMLGVRHCVFLTNATAGLEIAFRYSNLSRGDEVIVPAITFIATIAYPLAVGARVVFADVEPETLNLDPRDVERKITRRTRVIVPVHLGGRPVDMDPLLELARGRGILVVEDAAHAFGARYKGKPAGTLGQFGAFSFHEKKNVNSFGEGGILVTSLPLGEKLRQARFLGMDPSRKAAGWVYDVVALEGERGPFVAGNSSSTEIQAVGLSVQLRRMEKILEERRRGAEYLSRRFASCPALVPEPPDTPDSLSTHHLYLLQVNPQGAGRDVQKLKQGLAARGAANIPHFAPLYKFELLRRLGYDPRSCARSCPVAEEAFLRRFTHLPLHGLPGDRLAALADAVLDSAGEL
jgi:dTDP-4-amino-4,6-dideoxygalactose transaminase